ncbi:TetR/AcrR family transcriptional regulator [Bounagaea algeriensis]
MSHRGNRRAALAEAAIAVLARDGGRGLTHRAVDREAGFPEGTAKNYYVARSALLRAVAEHVAAEHAAAMRQLRETAPAGLAPDDITALYASMLRRMTTGARSRFLALFELHLEAVRDADVSAALGDMAEANADTAVALHAEVDQQFSRPAAALLDAGMLGVALSALSLPRKTLQRSGLDDADLLARALLTASRNLPPSATSIMGLVDGRAS